MTNPYTNITLIDVEPTEAAEWLAENGYTAAISPAIGDITLIYDKVLADSDNDEPIEDLLKLASEMSYELGCIAWLVIADADTLAYSLYIDGDLVDSYGANADDTPEGGDPESLATTFGQPKKQIKLIRRWLRADGAQPARHEKLLNALGLPRLALDASYPSIIDGTLPDGIDSKDDMIFVEADDETEDSA